MSLIPVKLPPGFYHDGTDYQAKGRWHDGNRVRWQDGALRPIGGWERRTRLSDDEPMDPIISDPVTETIRDLVFWDDPLGAFYGLCGSNEALYYINANNEVIDVTPEGYTPGGNYPIILNGYGISIYGRQDYGTPRSSGGALAIPATRWQFEAWGGEMLALPVQNGPIYTYTPGDPAATIMSTQAPSDNADFVVTDQRIVMVIDPDGTLGETREVRWSDSENYDEWTPALSNQAGSQFLTGVGRLLSIHKILNQVIILSQTDVHVARYLGSPYIYGFERVGDGCGPLNGFVTVTTDRFAMWLGDRQFWMYDGTIRVVDCDVMDYLVDNLDYDWISTIVGHSLAEFNEVWWHFKSNDADEVDSYLAYNYVLNCWHYGKLARTAAIDQTPTRDPLYIDPEGRVWNHELINSEAEDAYAVTGPLELGEGDKNMAVRYIFPDSDRFGDVNLTLLGRQMPTAMETAFGPYTYANPISTRAMGREIRLRVDGENAGWKVGNMRLEVAPIGTGLR